MHPVQNFKSVYMIGIGGIGMSALARYFKSKNVNVIGSDQNVESDTVKMLLKEGIEVLDQKKIDNYNVLKSIYNTDCVVYTLAIPPDNLELKISQAHEIPIFTYAEMLGQISENCFTIAVAGTHGKTTTTAMVTEIAKNLGLEANTIVGSFLFSEKDSGNHQVLTNFVSGDSDLFIVEACEYKRSFLNLKPSILVITNIEADHLDYYKDLADVKQAFFDLAAKVPKEGKIICNTTDSNLAEICKAFSEKVVDYSETLPQIPPLKAFGDHNKKNAAAAAHAISSYLQIKANNRDLGEIIDAVRTFKGTWRRMEYKGETEKGALIYSDYGHHPTEINVTVKSFQENFPDKKILLVFEPHLHSRTKMFFNEFVATLSLADRAIIYPIFRARAEEDFGVSSELLSGKINQNGGRSIFVQSFDEIVEEIEKLQGDWVVILLGAGEIYKVAELLTL